MLDRERTPADQMATHLLQVGHNGAIAVRLGIRLAPADQAFVRLDFDEKPGLAAARIDQKRGDLFDLHRYLAYGFVP